MRDLLSGWAPDVAPRLVGATLVSVVEDEPVTVVLTEVEAYTEDDPASHSHRGRTPRNNSMFARGGTAYVYRAYGIHWCLNVATGPEGEGSAVLFRSGVVHAGMQTVSRRRGREDRLADGPGKLAQALGVTGSHDGVDLTDSSAPLRLLPGAVLPSDATPRVGITRGTERRWRWVAVQPVSSPDPDPVRP